MRVLPLLFLLALAPDGSCAGAAPSHDLTAHAERERAGAATPALAKAALRPADASGDGLGPLLHATPDRVRTRLGDPDVARSEGKGAFWTYRLPHCALFLFFTEGPKGLRVTGADTGPRKRGEPLQSVSACLASAVTPPEPDPADGRAP